MRLLVHRGQALLLLVVGGLAGAAIAAAVLEWDAPPSPVAAGAIDFLSPSRSHLPDRIEIGGPSRPPSDDADMAATQAEPAPVAPDAAPSGRSVQPSPHTTVVPATVYSYPPDDGSTRGSGGSGSSGSGSGGDSGRDGRG